MYKWLSCFWILFLLVSCNLKETSRQLGESSVGDSEYPIQPVNIQQVQLTDAFWLPIIEKVQEQTIAFAIKKCKEEGRFDNFLIAGGQLEGTTRGAMPFDDTDVYKIIEGASNSLISAPNPQLNQFLDSLIQIIKVGQEKDGYLTTWRTINPGKPPANWVQVKEGKRWESLNMSHELYNAGHLYEAAVVHYKATGKRDFLDIALKNANLMVKTFGTEQNQIQTVPGHQIIETGLLKLYQITGEVAYKDLAKFFLDNRGVARDRKLFGAYSQDHLPVTQQKEVVGHAVRAVYMYAAMTDIAAIMKDTFYLRAVDTLWQNMVEKKMYITGGIGAKHEGEAFGANYELPNLTAYNETCAAIGDVYWNHRLHNLKGKAHYFDIIERTLYNGLISGISLDGKQFFYPNPLESDGLYQFNQGACTRKDWFDCSCCPTNLIRFIPSIPGLLYSKKANELFVNLYASNSATINLKSTELNVVQETNYPWDGTIRFTVNTAKPYTFPIHFRVPGWAQNQVLPSGLYQYENPNPSFPIKIKVNGKATAIDSKEGYLSLDRRWANNDVVEMEFPMDVKLVKTNTRVVENRGKVALERGPIVYAIEEVDNQNNFEDIAISGIEEFTIKSGEEHFGSVNLIETATFTAIPYYSWSNRGVNKMKVWIDKK